MKKQGLLIPVLQGAKLHLQAFLAWLLILERPLSHIPDMYLAVSIPVQKRVE